MKSGFPPALSFGSIGGPERRTDVVTLANGFEERNTPWAHSRRRYDAGLRDAFVWMMWKQLIAFFEARQGQMYRVPLEGLVGLQIGRSHRRRGQG